MRFNREEAFRLMMDATERAALQELAEMEGLSQAAMVRRLVRSEARERGLWPPSKQQFGERKNTQPATA